jgi:hypothetical protein
MSSNDMRVVLVHRAWADGSSWAKVIAPLAADGIQVDAAPFPSCHRPVRAARSVFSATCHKNVSPVVLVSGRRGRRCSMRREKPCDALCW